MEGIYWGDLRHLIERNALPWRVFRYYRSRDGFRDTISICDFTLPRREGTTHTGHAADDWYRDSFICNAGYFNGFIPLHDAPWSWDEEKRTWTQHPIRGAKELIRQLIAHKSISRSQEIEEFLRR